MDFVVNNAFSLMGTNPVEFTFNTGIPIHVRIFSPTLMTNTIQKTPARRIDFPRSLSFLLRPGKVYGEMATEARASWSTPMLILSVTAILVVIVAGYLKTRSAMMGEIPLPPDWQYWTPDMQNNYMQAQQATQGPAFMYVIPMVGSLTGLWLGWLVLAGLLHLGSTLFGGRGSMQSALNVVAFASLPFAWRDVLRVVYMLLAGHAISSPGLSGFAANPGLVSQLLRHTDIFLVWNIVLLAVGFSISDGLPRGKALISVLIVMAILLLAQAGLGLVGSGLGGSAIQRPFF